MQKKICSASSTDKPNKTLWASVSLRLHTRGPSGVSIILTKVQIYDTSRGALLEKYVTLKPTPHDHEKSQTDPEDLSSINCCTLFPLMSFFPLGFSCKVFKNEATDVQHKPMHVMYYFLICFSH